VELVSVGDVQLYACIVEHARVDAGLCPVGGELKRIGLIVIVALESDALRSERQDQTLLAARLADALRPGARDRHEQSGGHAWAPVARGRIVSGSYSGHVLLLLDYWTWKVSSSAAWLISAVNSPASA